MKTKKNKMTRRTVVRFGLAGGMGAATTGSLWAAKGKKKDTASSGGSESSGSTAQGRLQPFVQELPIMPVKEPVPFLDPAPDPAEHQMGFSKGNPVLFEMVVKEADHRFHPDLPVDKIFGYDGLFPGPTFVSYWGQPELIRIHNDLPANHQGFGIPEVSTHLHNMHAASESDGFPTDFYGPGYYRDHLYQFFPAGNDPAEIMNTMWYHDHRLDFTSQNTYKGLSGLHLAFDELDSGDETDSNPKALRLPSGPYDVPLFVGDKAFGPDGKLFFDLFNLDGILGDTWTVNGAVQPYFKAAKRKYRFRLLNGGPSRWYHFAFSDGRPFQLVANDGNLLEKPITMRGVQVSPAERMDIIVDFSDLAVGKSVFLVNRLEQKDGRGPEKKLKSLRTADQLMRIDIDRTAPDPSRVAATLRKQPVIDLSKVVRRREFKFDRTNGAWAVNGKFFDENVAAAEVEEGTAEIWKISTSGGWSHPVHIHFEEGRILTHNRKQPAPERRGRKDVYPLLQGDEMEIYLQFRDFTGRYPMHCHNTIHEDHAMMVRWDIKPRQTT